MTLLGPGAYNLDSDKKISGGVISVAMPNTDVDWAIKRARELPAPGDYNLKVGVVS